MHMDMCLDMHMRPQALHDPEVRLTEGTKVAHEGTSPRHDRHCDRVRFLCFAKPRETRDPRCAWPTVQPESWHDRGHRLNSRHTA